MLHFLEVWKDTYAQNPRTKQTTEIKTLAMSVQCMGVWQSDTHRETASPAQNTFFLPDTYFSS